MKWRSSLYGRDTSVTCRRKFSALEYQLVRTRTCELHQRDTDFILQRCPVDTRVFQILQRSVTNIDQLASCPTQRNKLGGKWSSLFSTASFMRTCDQTPSHKPAVWKTAAFPLWNESDIREMHISVSFSIDSSEIMTLDFYSVSFKPQVLCQLLNTYYKTDSSGSWFWLVEPRSKLL